MPFRFPIGCSLRNHQEKCNRPQRVKVTTGEQSILRCTQYQKEVANPYVIYADFQTLAHLIDDESSSQYQKHKIISYSSVVVDYEGRIVFNEFYYGLECEKRFLHSLMAAQNCIREIQPSKLLMMRLEDIEAFNAATVSHICNQPLNGDSVRDHDHITGLFRGAAHESRLQSAISGSI